MKTWKSKDGRVMGIADMTDQHLENAIRMIQRGYDRDGDVVPTHVALKLPLLIMEQNRRLHPEKCMVKKTKVTKKTGAKWDLVDVRFAENMQRLYTYRVRKNSGVFLGQQLVVEGDTNPKIVFVVGINTGRDTQGYDVKTITQKVSAL